MNENKNRKELFSRVLRITLERTENNISYDLDNMLYLKYRDELDGTRFGYDKELLKGRIEQHFKELKGIALELLEKCGEE